VRVLVSPKLSVLNNQTAISAGDARHHLLTRDAVGTPVTFRRRGARATRRFQPSFTTTPNVAAEGFMMAVLPQINDSDAIVLNVRPTIRRRVDSVRDPNPALQVSLQNPNAIPNEIPVFETREFDSILRLQSGQLGVLAGPDAGHRREHRFRHSRPAAASRSWATSSPTRRSSAARPSW
jgi:general secretion pathway protein D